MPDTPDYSVYLVTDRPLCKGRDLLDVVARAVRGGVTMVQLREKNAGTRDFVELGRAMMDLLKPSEVPLLINDRVDVALAIGANGVHVGQSDMAYADARELMGPNAIIGLSVETPEQAEEAELWNVDYYGVSPVFSTPTKTDTGKPWGIEGLRRLSAISRKPLVGIGSIGSDNAVDVIRAGAAGVAVVSAICSADDPEEAARALCRSVKAAL